MHSHLKMNNYAHKYAQDKALKTKQLGYICKSEYIKKLQIYMKLNKQFKGIFANLVGVDNTLGFVSITFGHNKKIDYSHVEKIVFEFAQKISNLLDYQNINS